MSDTKPIVLKPGTRVALEPAQLAETMKGFVWMAELGGQSYEVMFTGNTTGVQDENIELMIKEHKGAA